MGFSLSPTMEPSEIRTQVQSTCDIVDNEVRRRAEEEELNTREEKTSLHSLSTTTQTRQGLLLPVSARVFTSSSSSTLSHTKKMETSLRLGGDSKSLWPTNDAKSHRLGGDVKSLRLHAKEKIRIDSNTRLQVHGELDTRIGAPVFVSALIRHFYPDLSASLGVGLQFDKSRKLQYSVRGKKAFPVTTDGKWSFNIKGRCDVDKEFNEWRSRGAAEFTWSILNFQKEQDVRLKIGMEVSDKVPYMQIRENNWTFNADMNGKWNVRFDL